MADTRLERNNVNKGLRDYQRLIGEIGLWYEFDPVHTYSTTVYDEGPSRKWLPPRRIELLHVRRNTANQDPQDKYGFYDENSIEITLSYDTLKQTLAGDVDDEGARVHDRFRLRDELYAVELYQPAGRLRNFREVVIEIKGRTVMDDETHQDI